MVPSLLEMPFAFPWASRASFVPCPSRISSLAAVARNLPNADRLPWADASGPHYPTRNETHMHSYGADRATRQRVRRELVGQYARLQRDLMESEPTSTAYQNSIQAFRQMGYALISSGFEDDLDRLLRLRIMAGGRPSPLPLAGRNRSMNVHLIEQRPPQAD